MITNSIIGNMSALWKIFIISLFVAFLFQWGRWNTLGIIDSNMWSHQAEYAETNNPKQFTPLMSYGHPGGPIIEGTIAFHKIFDFSYYTSLITIVAVVNSIVIACICVLTYVYQKDVLWTLGVLGILSLNKLYNESTPPSAIASVLVVLLFILTLCLYKRKIEIRPSTLALFSIISGFLIATRVDIGTTTFITCIYLLYHITTIKKIFLVALGSFASFAIFDPYMWYMPLQHIVDLISQMLYHYNKYEQTPISFNLLAGSSFLAFLSILLLFALLFNKKEIPFPSRYVYTLLIFSSTLYGIFLTAQYKAVRYFQPIIFIWEIFLPLFLFTLISHIQFDFLETSERQEKVRETARMFVVGILLLYHVAIFAILLI